MMCTRLIPSCKDAWAWITWRSISVLRLWLVIFTPFLRLLFSCSSVSSSFLSHMIVVSSSPFSPFFLFPFLFSSCSPFRFPYSTFLPSYHFRPFLSFFCSNSTSSFFLPSHPPLFLYFLHPPLRWSSFFSSFSSFSILFRFFFFVILLLYHSFLISSFLFPLSPSFPLNRPVSRPLIILPYSIFPILHPPPLPTFLSIPLSLSLYTLSFLLLTLGKAPAPQLPHSHDEEKCTVHLSLVVSREGNAWSIREEVRIRSVSKGHESGIWVKDVSEQSKGFMP